MNTNRIIFYCYYFLFNQHYRKINLFMFLFIPSYINIFIDLLSYFDIFIILSLLNEFFFLIISSNAFNKTKQDKVVNQIFDIVLKHSNKFDQL